MTTFDAFLNRVVNDCVEARYYPPPSSHLYAAGRCFTNHEDAHKHARLVLDLRNPAESDAYVVTCPGPELCTLEEAH